MLAGCSAEDMSSRRSLDDYGQNQIVAAHRSEVEAFLESNENELLQNVLADGWVEDAELIEVGAHFKQCLADAGYSDVTLYRDGGSSIGFSDGQEKDTSVVSERCDEESGFSYAGMFYSAMRRNPLNEDESELAVQCLKENGVVEKSFTADDYNQVTMAENPDEEFLSKPEFQRCMADPLGLLADQPAEIEVP